MKLDNGFFTCKICGEHKGRGFDHDECSKVLKETIGPRSENRRPNRRLTAAYADYLAKKHYER